MNHDSYSGGRYKLGLAVMAVSLFGGWHVSGAPTQPQQATAPGLETIFEDGVVVQDRNGDGHIDFVDAHLVLGESPSDIDVAAAANIAARLGFETSSMNLPITGPSEGVAIAIGQRGLARLDIPPSRLGVDMEPGVGVVAFVDGETQPVLAVTGGDDAGTSAAAIALSANAPHLWDPEGETFADVIAAIDTILGAEDIEVSSARVARLIVEAGSSGLRRLDVEVTVPAATIERAENVLAAADGADEADEADEVDEVDEVDGGDEVDLRFAGVRLLRVYLSAPGGEATVIHVVGDAKGSSVGSGRRPGGGDKDDIGISNLFTNDGFLGDSDRNLLPDRVDVVLSAAGDVSGATADLAARIGLEATGVSIPIALAPDEIDDPEEQPPLVLIGNTHPLIEQLIEDEKFVLPDLEPGQGLIRVVHEAFGDKSAVVIVGGDNAGLERAIRQVAERFPHVWERGKDRATVEDMEYDLWAALSGRSPVGQAATAVYKVDQIADVLEGRDLEEVQVAIYVEKADDDLANFVRGRIEDRLTADALEVTVGNIDVQDGDLLIDEDITIASEVDEYWSLVRERVVPQVGRGDAVTITSLLSEPPEVRARIERETRDELMAAGADPNTTSVTVLSAYKQGYSWLYDVVRPALETSKADHITIRFAEIGAPEDWPQQAMYTPTRWLLEIFPIDEVLSRDLGLQLDDFEFEMMPIGSPAYEVIAQRGGEEVYRETFDPKYVLRPYFDRFPDYEKARVTTGWLNASVGERTVTDQRIVTDIERFWDHFQSNTLMRIYEYVMRNGEGKPRASDAPHFGELRIDVSLSEPDYQVGVDKEQVASMEALHEEIYFATLHFFDVMGRMASGQAFNYPGRVIPVVHPKSDGAPGNAKITLTGFGAGRPTAIVRYRERGGRDIEERRDILPTSLDRPIALGALVRAGRPGLERLDFRAKVNFERDRRSEFVRRTSARNVDSRITSAEQLTATLADIGALRGAGLYGSHLTAPDFGAIELSAFWGHEYDPDSQITMTLPGNASPNAAPDIRTLLPEGYRWSGETLVQWDTPIPPPEAAEILARMSTFPQATGYQVGESYLGKQIWAMDLVAPVDGAYWSQAKASARKPTVMYSARQHANEVSSTSHVLKLAELLLTDPRYEHVLDTVNVVIHPITNADGAQLAYDLYQVTPDHMLHAGYLGSLGVDVSSGQGNDYPMYPETKVRPKLWTTWLPDIFLNPHGYPSHEWVQIFSEYAGWVRTRATESRGWWGMRGWFMPGFSYVNSPDFPDHMDAAFDIRSRITENINALPAIRALNDRAYDRYRRYGFEWDDDNFKMDFTDSVLIYTSITGSTGSGGGRGGVMNNPRVTIWSGTTEAPDETAYGEWMQFVASAGLAWDKALLEYLLQGNHKLERTERQFAGGVSFTINRPRPATAEEEESGDSN